MIPTLHSIHIRVVKQTLRGSGANVTHKHIGEISMCALFLLEAAKTYDKVFGVHPSSTAHTTRDPSSDVRKMTKSLLEKEVIVVKSSRTSPSFVDPTKSGMATLTKGEWLQKQLAAKSEDYLQEEEGSYSEVDFDDLDYELFDHT